MATRIVRIVKLGRVMDLDELCISYPDTKVLAAKLPELELKNWISGEKFQVCRLLPWQPV